MSFHKSASCHIAIVSGGFDPPHIGHTRLFSHARSMSDKLYVIINNDNWLMKKKGFIFMSEFERVELINEFQSVDFTLLSFHDKNPSHMDVANELAFIALAQPENTFIFCNGGDRKVDNVPTAEEKVCAKYGIQMEYNIGGEKLQSSSWLLEKAGGSCRKVIEL